MSPLMIKRLPPEPSPPCWKWIPGLPLGRSTFGWWPTPPIAVLSLNVLFDTFNHIESVDEASTQTAPPPPSPGSVPGFPSAPLAELLPNVSPFSTTDGPTDPGQELYAPQATAPPKPSPPLSPTPPTASFA